MVTILLARHGESDWNREDRWQGHADRPLSPLGVEQAHALAQRLAAVDLDAVHASDLARARETASAVAGPRGLPVTTHPGLREVDVGSWTGLSWSELAERYPDGRRRWDEGETGWENGEDYAAMAERAVATLLAIAASHAPGPGTVLVVAHGGPVRAAIAAATGVDVLEIRRAHPTPANAELVALGVDAGRLRLLDPPRPGEGAAPAPRRNTTATPIPVSEEA